MEKETKEMVEKREGGHREKGRQGEVESSSREEAYVSKREKSEDTK